MYILIIFISKLIPIYILLRFKSNPFILNIKTNIINSLFIFIIYFLYLNLNGINIYKFYTGFLNKVIEGQTPIIYIIKNILQP